MTRRYSPSQWSRFEREKVERFDRSTNPLRDFAGSYIPKCYIAKFSSLTAVENFVKSIGYKVTEINFDRSYVTADFEWRLYMSGYVSRETEPTPF